jgi:hypothetical protein
MYLRLLFIACLKRFCLFRFLPVGVFATAWLNTKILLGTLLKNIGRRLARLANRVTPPFAAFARKANRCFRMTELEPSSHEMRTVLCDDLKRSLIA